MQTKMLLLFLLLSSGCGVSAGGFVAGTTSFLHEVNAGQKVAAKERITDAERAEMTAFLEKTYGGRDANR